MNIKDWTQNCYNLIRNITDIIMKALCSMCDKYKYQIWYSGLNFSKFVFQSFMKMFQFVMNVLNMATVSNVQEFSNECMSQA